MKLHHRAAIVMGLAVPAACSSGAPTAVRGRHTLSASPPPAEPSTTTGTAPVPVPESSATTTEPAAGPTTTTLVVTTTSPLVVTPTTIRMPLPEEDAPAGQQARVSWYGAESGEHTANGDAYDPDGLTFAHLSMPFGTRVMFKGPLGSVVATCTDRGPASWTGKTFDLSRGAFSRIAQLAAGVAEVTWSVVA